MSAAGPLALAVIGDGRMGCAVRDVATASGETVVAFLGPHDAVNRETLRGATVAVEFTEPGAAPSNVRACADAGCPIVVGTTGWYDALPAAARYVHDRNGALLWAPNFSLGVALLTGLVQRAAELSPRLPGFAAALIETHHARKKDAPSGTALALLQAWRDAGGGEMPVTSIRVGHVPGTHELVLDGDYEQLTLRHEARDPRVFAHGALAAARWLPGRHGVFTLSDMLQISGASHD